MTDWKSRVWDLEPILSQSTWIVLWNNVADWIWLCNRDHGVPEHHLGYGVVWNQANLDVIHVANSWNVSNDSKFQLPNFMNYKWNLDAIHVLQITTLLFANGIHNLAGAQSHLGISASPASNVGFCHETWEPRELLLTCFSGFLSTYSPRGKSFQLDLMTDYFLSFLAENKYRVV